MNCDEARSLLECYADMELDAAESMGVDAHLRQCEGCTSAMSKLNELRTLIRDGATYHRAPDLLTQRIRKQIAQQGPARPPGAVVSWSRWLRPIALVAATAAVTWLAASLLLPLRSDRLAEQVVASHARSTLSGHLAEVVSSERHTVKPWLSTKLDFSPPVRDLTDAGFPLVGARLDYVDRRPVAALVYTRRKHVINLFIWPDTGDRPRRASSASSANGYNLLQWNAGDMTFWAISDLNAAELGQFAERFASSK